MWGCHTQRQCLKWQNPLAKKKKKKRQNFLIDSGEHSNFSVKKDLWCSIVEKPFFNIKNQFVIARVPRRWVQVVDKSPIMTPIQSAWMVNCGNSRILFVNETSSSTVMGTNRCLLDSFWAQLKKFASLISWPPWFENQQIWIIKIGADIIIQLPLVLSESLPWRAKPFIMWW